MFIADMDNGAGLSLYPLHRCKTIHLVGIKFENCLFLYLMSIADVKQIVFGLKGIQDGLLSWLLLANQGLLQNHTSRSGMRRGSTMLMERRVIKHTCVLNFLMLTLHSLDGSRSEQELCTYICKL